MANGDHNHSDRQSTGVLGQDVGCPGCGYNLRGLGSDDVVCPECGLASNVATLLVRRWDKPWYRAPKYNLLCLPAGVILLCMVGWPISLVALDVWMDGASPRMSTIAWMGVGLVFWFGVMALVWQKMDGPTSAGFALLAHLSLVGYLGSLFMVLPGVVMMVTAIIDFDAVRSKPVDMATFTGGGLLLLGGIGIFVLSRWIERLDAGHCIRLYFRRPTTSG